MPWNPPVLPPELVTCYQEFAPRRLKPPSLPRLTLAEVEEELSYATMYNDDAQELRRLLPYYFEALWENYASTTYLDLIALSPLGYIWSSWPDGEREAVRDALALLWHLALEHENEADLCEILSTLQELGLSWIPFLEIWLHSPVSAALVSWAIPSTDWERLPSDAAVWLCQQAVRNRVQADFFAASTDEDRERISRFEAALTIHCRIAK